MDCIISNDIVLPISVDYSAILIDGSFIVSLINKKVSRTLVSILKVHLFFLINKHLLEYQGVLRIGLRMVLGTVEVMEDDAVLSRKHQSLEIWKKIMRNCKIRESAHSTRNKTGIMRTRRFYTPFDRTKYQYTVSPCSHEEVNTLIMLHARMQPCKACQVSC